MEYQIVEKDGRKELEGEVRSLIADGWEPLGGVSITQQLCDETKRVDQNHSTLYDAGQIYAQAMVKR